MKRILTAILALVTACGTIAASGSGVGAEENTGLSAPDTSTIVVENGYVRNIAGIPTVSELIAQLDGHGNAVSVVGLSENDRVANGTKILCGDSEYTAVISGDLYPDAKINARDIIAMMRQLVGADASDESGAFDVNLDGAKNAKDILHVMRYMVGWDVALGAEYFTYSEEPVTAPSEDSTLSLVFGDNLTKTDKKLSTVSGTVTDTIRLAKNEIEFTQFYLTSETTRSDLKVSATDFVSLKGDRIPSELLAEYYFKVNDAASGKEVYYADALPPASVYDFKLPAGENQGFVIKAKTSADTPAGLYRAKISVMSGDKVVKRADVYAQVWDFALSDDTACATAFGLSRYSIYTYHKQYEGDDGLLYRAYYDFMLENRLSAYYLPYSVLDDKADEYMSNPRVTSFMIDGRDHPNASLTSGDMTDEELEAAYAKLSKNEDWMKKGYFYYVDEPWNGTMVSEIVESADRLKKHFPDYRLTVPYLNEQIDGRDLSETMRNAGVNLWCPLSAFWTHSDCTVPGANKRFSASTEARYGTAEERFAGYVGKGDELWWYVCITPQYPYANFFSTYQGTMSRVLFWQQYMYNIDGVLYWAVNDWQNGAEWRTMNCGFDYGDGRLIYCGAKYGIRGPISSIRLELVRDGIEDFQYLRMAEERFGREKVDEILRRVTTGILDYTRDADVLRAARDELGRMLAE